MTAKARLVLSDCERALTEIEIDFGSELWRPQWVGLVALLRAVGSVLGRIDNAHDPITKRVIEASWEELRRTKPDPRIFWEFIYDERNNVVHAYEFGFGIAATVRPGTAHINLKTGETWSSPSGPTTFSGFMRSGTFAGQDPLDLCRAAIRFWHDYLDSIDRRVLAERHS